MSYAHEMELLAPAGGMEQLRAAVLFGADAVYLAGQRFGMRAQAANFSPEELEEAVALAHAANVDVHLTANIQMMQGDLRELPAFFEAADEAGVDALIIGDMGAFAIAREHAPHCALHVSTQASVSNSKAALAWAELGAKRIVCAREMTLEDIAAMRSEIPDELELEVFAHGAQCMAVSGRCLISSYLTGRSGNRGNCTQPCRWNYSLEEREKRPGVRFPIEEDARGTYIMNAKDLNMASHLRELKDAGVDSIKLEGRNKKAFYVATVVNAYRNALDGADDAFVQEELSNISHRPYSTGFFYGSPEQADSYDGYEQESLHVADVIGCEAGDDGFDILLRCRNKFELGEELEALDPKSIGKVRIDHLEWLEGEDGHDAAFASVDVAARTCETYRIRSKDPITPGSFLRRRQFRRTSRELPQSG